MLKKYEKPIVEVITFSNVDIIRTSTGFGFDDEIEIEE